MYLLTALIVKHINIFDCNLVYVSEKKKRLRLNSKEFQYQIWAQ